MKPHALPFALLLAATALPVITAGTITTTLPEFSGTLQNVTFPQPSIVIGSFNYSIPAGQNIVAALYTSTFGNSIVSNSAGVDVSVAGILVGSCPALAACDVANSVTPFSFNFQPSDFSKLASGSLIVSAVQNSASIIRLGSETLTITTATPEPGSIALLGLGLLTIGMMRWRFNRRSPDRL